MVKVFQLNGDNLVVFPVFHSEFSALVCEWIRLQIVLCVIYSKIVLATHHQEMETNSCEKQRKKLMSERLKLKSICVIAIYRTPIFI